MGNDYFIFYSEGNIVCIIILIIILVNDRINNSLQEKQVWFNRTIITHILYFISDIFWAALMGGQLPQVRVLVGISNFLNYILLGMIAYEWFMYMAVAEKMAFTKSGKKKLVCLLPMVISVLVIVIAYAAAPYFWISEKGKLNDLYYPLQVSAPAVYLIVALVLSMKNANKAETSEDKETYRLIGLYPIAVFLFGMIQIILVNAPTFCFGVTVMLLYFYIKNMQMRISVDALTRLNNRGQIIRYMEEIKYNDDVKNYVIMIDIDRFKEINDTYGHMEGDRALILVSEALKQVCEEIKTPVFLGRYGGDEFTIFLQEPKKNKSPDELAKEIRSALAEKKSDNKLPYDLEVSIGYDELRDKDNTMQDCMIRADEMLYADKRRRRNVR